MVRRAEADARAGVTGSVTTHNSFIVPGTSWAESGILLVRIVIVF